MGRWGDGEMGRWGDGVKRIYKPFVVGASCSLVVFNSPYPMPNALRPNPQFPMPNSKFGQNIKQRKKYNPDDIYEVPVDFCHLDSGVFVFAVMSGATGTP